MDSWIPENSENSDAFGPDELARHWDDARPTAENLRVLGYWLDRGDTVSTDRIHPDQEFSGVDQ